MNKLVVQQVKSIFNSLPNKDLDKLLNLLLAAGITKNQKQVGYKCVECSIMFKGINASGFGRDEVEAVHICLKNFIEQMLEEEGHLIFLRNILRELKQLDFQEQDIEQLQQKIGNISIIQNNQNYQTVDSLLNGENEQILGQIVDNKTKKFETLQDNSNKENISNQYQKCCNHEQELKKEKMRVEHLELRIKLILEENRILKSLLNEKKETTRQDSNREGDTKRIRQQVRSSSVKMSKIQQINGVPKLNLDALPTYMGKQKALF
ncbi:unnamed protein product [Paramecium primaurelia]|uniref:Uncharacterized protein n=1 Tax=Paramecium primaurelia TaxID=5886 RepID=A0A8S1Q5S4_PARPR|nr:unnamed protein product [Paramecium primaurelia]